MKNSRILEGRIRTETMALVNDLVAVFRIQAAKNLSWNNKLLQEEEEGFITCGLSRSLQ
jgi:hypothetical protein